ncbi:MAG: hypothetical protein H0W49_16040 [Nitrospirales bacterium]|nr:hypothetical protein [Nitrospirales bacterium]
MTRSVSRIPGVALLIGQKANLSTVGPGWRVWGIAVYREEGTLNLSIELAVTVDKDSSMPALSTRVRSMVRDEIQSLTSEEVGWINIRIGDVHLTE